MKTKLSDAQKIKRVAEKNGWKFRPGYSGRGMFGKTCPGIACASFYTRIVLAKVRSAKVNGIGSIDNMGRDMIVYWPSVDDDPETYSQSEDGET